MAENELRRASSADIGDWFQFEIGGGRAIGDNTVRLSVNAVIGATSWVEFHVDLVGSDIRMTGQPEDVPPLARGVILDVEQRGYRAYPLVDHVADKVAATYEVTARIAGHRRGSAIWLTWWPSSAELRWTRMHKWRRDRSSTGGG